MVGFLDDHRLLIWRDGKFFTTSMDNGATEAISATIPKSSIIPSRFHAANISPISRGLDFTLRSGGQAGFALSRNDLIVVFALAGDPCVGEFRDNSLVEIQGFWNQLYTFRDVDISPDKETIAASCYASDLIHVYSDTKSLHVWDRRIGKLKWRSKSPRSMIQHVAYSPNGQWIATVEDVEDLATDVHPRDYPRESTEGGYMEIVVRDVRTGVELARQFLDYFQYSNLCFSSDSKYVAASFPNEVRIFDVPHLSWHRSLPWTADEKTKTDYSQLQAKGVVISPEGTYAVTGGTLGYLQIWRIDSGD